MKNEFFKIPGKRNNRGKLQTVFNAVQCMEDEQVFLAQDIKQLTDEMDCPMVTTQIGKYLGHLVQMGYLESEIIPTKKHRNTKQYRYSHKLRSFLDG